MCGSSVAVEKGIGRICFLKIRLFFFFLVMLSFYKPGLYPFGVCHRDCWKEIQDVELIFALAVCSDRWC